MTDILMRTYACFAASSSKRLVLTAWRAFIATEIEVVKVEFQGCKKFDLIALSC